MKHTPTDITLEIRDRSDEDWQDDSQEEETSGLTPQQLVRLQLELMAQVEEPRRVLDLSDLSWQFEWIVVPGPDTLQ